MNVDTADLQRQLQTTEAELKETHDRLLRVSAEFDNYKKRSARETSEFRKYANQALLKDLLPVVDNLDLAFMRIGQIRALQHALRLRSGEGGWRAAVVADEGHDRPVRERFGLDRPLPEQFVRYVGQTLRGDLGTSFLFVLPVAPRFTRFPYTTLLAVGRLAQQFAG